MLVNDPFEDQRVIDLGAKYTEIDDLVDRSEIIFLTIKPNKIEEISNQLKNLLSNQLIISFIAGLKFNKLKTLLEGHENIIRAKGKTFKWGGRYNQDYSTRDTLFTELGVFEHFSPQIKSTKNNNGILFLANIHPSLQLDVLDKMTDNISLVVSDTMNLWIDLDIMGLHEVIKKSNIFLLLI